MDGWMDAIVSILLPIMILEYMYLNMRVKFRTIKSLPFYRGWSLE